MKKKHIEKMKKRGQAIVCAKQTVESREQKLLERKNWFFTDKNMQSRQERLQSHEAGLKKRMQQNQEKLREIESALKAKRSQRLRKQQETSVRLLADLSYADCEFFFEDCGRRQRVLAHMVRCKSRHPWPVRPCIEYRPCPLVPPPRARALVCNRPSCRCVRRTSTACSIHIAKAMPLPGARCPYRYAQQ